MKIKRIVGNQEMEFELTHEEIAQANAEFITDWMISVLLDNNSEMSEEEAQEYGQAAYELYCEGTGYTEYECVEKMAEQYKQDHKTAEDDTEE